MDVIKTKGSSFLVVNVSPGDIFTPEDFTDSHRLIAKTASDFVKEEVLPEETKLEEKRFEIAKELLRKSAQLGLLGADMPEEYGGLNLGKITSALIAEKLAASSYFLVAFAAHNGIGTLPLLLFGNKEQKERYLPGLAAADLIGAYALTEAGAGSDVSAMKTAATIAPGGGGYILNGEKIWITNAGFANFFTVFAKVDGKITAFLVERGFPGFGVGEKEEHKLGLLGSSTRPLTFEDAEIPAENLLGSVGDGFKIAMNVLNLGRFKLAAGCVGGAKNLLAKTAVYAKERKTFGRPISKWGLIENKFGKMATEVWLAESMVYRTAGLLDEILENIPPDDSVGAMAAIAEYAAECSLNKVYASEMYDEVIDECLQIYGGMGFDGGSEPARAYRDARVNRIFEGTNEINRLSAADRIIKTDKSAGGELPLFDYAKKYLDDAVGLPSGDALSDEPLATESSLLVNLKKLTVMLLGGSAQKFFVRAGGDNKKLRQIFMDEEEVLAHLADCAMRVFALESGLLRTKKMIGRGADAEIETLMVKIAAHRFSKMIACAAQEVSGRLAEGDELGIYQSIVRRMTKYNPQDAIGSLREVADAYLENRWRFS